MVRDMDFCSSTEDFYFWLPTNKKKENALSAIIMEI